MERIQIINITKHARQAASYVSQINWDLSIYFLVQKMQLR